MDRAISQWKLRNGTNFADSEAFLKKLLKSYVLYGTLLLLPSTAYDELDSSDQAIYPTTDDLKLLYQLMVQQLKVTNVATTRPIPLLDNDNGEENLIRSPKNFTPLHGDFGPATSSNPPTVEDLHQAYWVSAKQNGIYQTWAPRWTMFSRGNISEKARVLALPSVTEAVREGRESGSGCAAVDLYSGIGYFAFSYLKAGVSKVLCWDLNPWSVEGLMRGAKANKWDALRGDSTARIACWDDDVRLLAFNEDNVLASSWVHAMRRSLPPIRHVNCGLLPTSCGSWRTALEVLDPLSDGWIHIHENFAVAEIEPKAEEVRSEIQRLSEEVRGDAAVASGQVRVDHINRLKSYAPGVMHVVIDIYVPRHMPS